MTEATSSRCSRSSVSHHRTSSFPSTLTAFKGTGKMLPREYFCTCKIQIHYLCTIFLHVICSCADRPVITSFSVDFATCRLPAGTLHSWKGGQRVKQRPHTATCRLDFGGQIINDMLVLLWKSLCPLLFWSVYSAFGHNKVLIYNTC